MLENISQKRSEQLKRVKGGFKAPVAVAKKQPKMNDNNWYQGNFNFNPTRDDLNEEEEEEEEEFGLAAATTDQRGRGNGTMQGSY